MDPSLFLIANDLSVSLIRSAVLKKSTYETQVVLTTGRTTQVKYIIYGEH